MSRYTSMTQLYRDALNAQNDGLTPVANALADAVVFLRNQPEYKGTDWINRHPAVQLFVYRLADLARTNDEGEGMTAAILVATGYIEKHEEEDQKRGLRPISKYADLIPAEEFGDGYGYEDNGGGYWATTEGVSDIDCFLPKPPWATHVAWVNK